MTPRELMVAGLSRKFGDADPPGPGFGPSVDLWLAVAAEAGLALVPRERTEAMINAVNALEVTKQVNDMLIDAAQRRGRDTGLPARPNSVLEQQWAAMLAAATEP